MFKVISKIEQAYDLNVVMYFENQIKICEHISDVNKKLIEKLIAKKEFTAKKGEVLKVEFLEGEYLISMLFLGLGKEEEFSDNIYREVIFENLSKEKGSILISSENAKLSNYKILAEIVGNINYNFDDFKTKKENEVEKSIEVHLFFTEQIEDVNESIILANSTDIAKKLVDLPANIINPESLSKRSIELGKEYGFEVEVIDEKGAEELGMNLLLAVGRASITKSKLIIMRYMGNSSSEEIIGLVGKGLTYDTGGLCTKSPDSMFDMKTDMAGAASVIGAMCAISKNKLKKNVIAVIPACENAIDGNAYRPGDIIKSMNGKSVEIINTDAEGRLVLADAITYIVRNEKVTEIIDLATLTGAIMVALGTITTGVFSTCDERYSCLEKASSEHGEKVWRMPLFDEYEELLKSTVADVKHTGGRMGGSITAAKFLQGFTEGLPWIHMDIAGTSYDSGVKWNKKGATGVGVKSLYTYIKNR
ncbi:leucyl aminopeptidase [Cetobacterium sp.]|uniref:leucyl aminopeptidase n=1 Tax=Cetobacterium sp. TaxID=2071632 RepID=UPI002FCA602D